LNPFPLIDLVVLFLGDVLSSSPAETQVSLCGCPLWWSALLPWCVRQERASPGRCRIAGGHECQLLVGSSPPTKSFSSGSEGSGLQLPSTHLSFWGNALQQIIVCGVGHYVSCNFSLSR
jgi:hypothetical protein